MITFYPGPSKIYPQIRDYMQESYDSGILSMNHRSSASMILVEKTVNLLKEKLLIPEEYSIFFVSSATECWEIIVQSLIRNGSLHFYSGEFGKKWAEYTQKHLINIDNLANQVICLTHNETSNGSYLENKNMAFIRKKYTNALIAVDVTSSMGGLLLEWKMADIWFSSVQKCFGLPAGLAIMICSPKAIEQAFEINDRKYYNSIILLHENMLKFQTTHTPNILNIFLLSKVMEMVEPITMIDTNIRKRARKMYEFLESNNFKILPINSIFAMELIENTAKNTIIEQNELKSNFSPTVLTITASEEEIAQIKNIAKKDAILLGNGYGKWKNTTLRIANFPAITDLEFEILKENLLLSFL